jgi:hypothetical protein
MKSVAQDDLEHVGSLGVICRKYDYIVGMRNARDGLTSTGKLKHSELRISGVRGFFALNVKIVQSDGIVIIWAAMIEWITEHQFDNRATG